MWLFYLPCNDYFLVNLPSRWEALVSEDIAIQHTRHEKLAWNYLLIPCQVPDYGWDELLTCWPKLCSPFFSCSSISFRQWVFSETMTSEPRRAREKGREERLKAYRWDGQDRVKVMDSGVRPLEIRCSNSYDYFSPLCLGFPQVHVKYMRWQETTGTCYHIVG